MPDMKDVVILQFLRGKFGGRYEVSRQVCLCRPPECDCKGKHPAHRHIKRVA